MVVAVVAREAYSGIENASVNGSERESLNGVEIGGSNGVLAGYYVQTLDTSKVWQYRSLNPSLTSYIIIEDIPLHKQQT